MKRSLHTALAAASLLILLNGCSPDSEQAQLDAAKASVEKKDNGAAIVRLKALLQKNPNSAEARFLLAKAMVAAGETTAAAVELNKAAELGYAAAKVIPALALTMLMQGKDRQLIAEHEKTDLNDARATAELRALVATAYTRTGNAAKAQLLVDQALALAPDLGRALLIQARLKASAGDFAGAHGLVERVTRAEPNNAEAWTLLGDVEQLGLNHPPEARAAYDQAIEVEPGYVQAHSKSIGLALQRGELDAAASRVAGMKKALPGHPQTAYMEVQLLAARGEMPQAKNLVQSLLKVAPLNPRLLQLAGYVEFELGNSVLAESQLSRALSQDPGLEGARRLLARTYLRQRRPTQALGVLAPILDRPDADAETLGIAGEAQLTNGKLPEAEALFARASKLAPADTRLKTAVALMQLSHNGGAAFDSLTRIAAEDKGTFADMALISARIRRKELDPALAAIDALEKKLPGKPLAPSLRGDVLELKRDFAGARTAYESALKADPGFFPAAQKLSRLDLRDGKPAAARDRLESVLKTDPRHVPAMVALAELTARTGGGREKIEALLKNAVQLNPTQPEPRIVLARHYLALKETKQALLVAQDAAAALPNDADILDTLGQAQWRNGNIEQAVTTLKRVVAMKPYSPAPLMRLAEFYRATNDKPATIASLQRALAISPDLPQAQEMMVATMVRAKDFKGAIAFAREVQRRKPKDPAGFALEGLVEAARPDLPAAAGAFRASLQLGKSGAVVLRLHRVLLQMNRPDEAEQLAAQWLKDNRRDVDMLLQGAAAAESARKWPIAESRYRDVLRVIPDHPVANNNLAWLLLRTGKPGALDFAQKAYKLIPDDPGVADTLALALASANQTDKAIEMQRKLVAAAPNGPAHRLTLARIYLLAGNKEAARTELERLARLGNKFDRQDEVAELAKSL